MVGKLLKSQVSILVREREERRKARLLSEYPPHPFPSEEPLHSPFNPQTHFHPHGKFISFDQFHSVSKLDKVLLLFQTCN